MRAPNPSFGQSGLKTLLTRSLIVKLSLKHYTSFPNNFQSITPTLEKAVRSRRYDGRDTGEFITITKSPQSTLLFDTLYIGGGTPSLLGPKNLTTLITGLNNIFVIPAKAGIHSAVGSGFGTLSNFVRNGEILSTAAEMYDRPAGRGESALPCHSERSEESSVV